MWMMLWMGFGAAWAGQARDATEDAAAAAQEADDAVAAGPSADLNVLAPSLRRVRAGQGEVAVHAGAIAYAWGVYNNGDSGVGPVSSVRAGYAPVDRLWVDVRAGYGATFTELDLGLGMVYGTASYALVDTDHLRTGPSLAAGLVGVDGGIPFGAVGWSVVGSPHPALSFDLSLYGAASQSAAGTTPLPYGEAGMTLQPVGSNHSVRVGLAALAPTAAYRYEDGAWFAQVHATGIVMPFAVGVETGLEVGARW